VSRAGETRLDDRPRSLLALNSYLGRNTTLAFVSSVGRRATELAPQAAAHLSAQPVLVPRVGSRSAGL
jgi:hypothetical protein